MESELQRSLSVRLNRRGDRGNQNLHSKDVEGGSLFPEKLPQDYPMKIVWKKGFIRLVLVTGILWMLLILIALLFHIWSCQSSVSLLSAMCNRDSKVFTILDTMGLVSKSQHRCPIPVADDPDKVPIPKGRTSDKTVKNLSYIIEDEISNNGSQETPLFGGHQSWSQREQSFNLSSTMKVHCGFIRNGGAEMDTIDINYVKKCRFVVASGIFDGYDIPHQPSNISLRSKKLFCFLMVVDELSLKFITENVTVKVDGDGGKWVGIWRLVLLKHPPYDEPRRNGKVPKILTHKLFPQAQYSIWIDGKMELIVDPLLILERYLWRGEHTFAIAQHKHHKSIYEEADANKRRKRYARPLIDLHMKIYYYEGMKPWGPEKKTVSDVPEGAVIIREHTVMNNLFSCLWFNEVNLFTPRDQLSFGYVVYRLGGLFKFFMFPNCEYNSLFVLHPHTREHSSPIEWVKELGQLKNSSLKESRGGLGLWTPYPGNLDSVVLPNVSRTSKAG
ncbi:Plant/F20M13-60 protein [Quillaja saponaria]|uniref:Plant/F20M13-60 protein n=1 Tax=Quillaja saponaria TaxID=32244 RepID=A0AAD7PHN0_QUISA|nr:Plant/F20M13-60 protein [Quillaja saponaria]